MTRDERMELIRHIEDKTNSRLLVYITGDRRGLETKIAFDTFPFILQHLTQIGHQRKISLYLYSTGGITMAGYALVNLIREYCDSFDVIIPFKALSCATLVALGADRIILSKMAQLSPIDPSVQSPLGPLPKGIPPTYAPGPIPVSVEDVIGYLDLAKDQGLKSEESLVKVFEVLSKKVHPLILGQVFRTRQEIVFLAKKLLSYHMREEQKIEQITTTIYKGRFSHDYIIGRKEAKEIGLPVIEPDPDFEKDMIGLFLQYNNLLEMSTPYNPETILGSDEVSTGVFNRAIIESLDLTHVFRTIKEIRRIQIAPPQVPIPTIGYQEKILSESWIMDNSI
ncbi:MAG: serine protease [Candidatus Bathyarchaeia archaeon]